MQPTLSHLVPKLPVDLETGKSLTDVLGQSEHVKELVEQSAQELSSVNTELAHETVLNGEPSGVRLNKRL